MSGIRAGLFIRGGYIYIYKINKRFVCRTSPCHNASAGIERGSVFHLGCPLVIWPWLRGNAKCVPLNVLYHCPLEHEAICPPAAGCQACLNPDTASYTGEQSKEKKKKRGGLGVGGWSAGPFAPVSSSVRRLTLLVAKLSAPQPPIIQRSRASFSESVARR